MVGKVQTGMKGLAMDEADHKDAGLEAQQSDTLSVEEAGRRAGLGRNASYDAVKRGEIPAVRFGRKLRVPRIAFERILAGK